jgi:integrase/recombinase XerD
MPENDDEKRSATNSEDEESEERPGLELPKILTYDEIDRFLLKVDDIEDLVAFRLMLFAGLRVSEATDVLVKDIDPESRAVFVRQGKGSKDRYAPIDIATIAQCQCYAQLQKLKPDDHLFDRTTRTLQRHVTETGQRADLKVHAHMLRHTCATWQLDKSIPLEVVKNNLGHSSIEVTQIYLHLNIRQRSRTYSDCTRFGI